MNESSAVSLMQNRYPGRCNNPACNINVNSFAGYTQRVNGRYVVWCNNCVQRNNSTPISPPTPPKSQVRCLTANCKIIVPYEPENLPLIKSLPGARWDGVNRFWSVSELMADRRRILEVAEKIGLEVDPSLLQIEVTEQAQVATSAGLYPFQVEGVNFLSHKKKALLGDDMGLGKTVQSLMTIPVKNGKALVICRAGLKYNWLDEVNKWRNDLKPVVLSGNGNFRWPNNGEVVIINYNILPSEFHTLPRNKGERIEDFWDRLKVWREQLKANNPQAEDAILIVDEAHDFKNYESQRSRKVKEIARLVGKLIGLTGSPLTNRPEDLYGVFDVLGLAKETFGTLEKFKILFNAREKVVNQRGNIKTIYGKPEAIVPELLRRVMLRRIRSEVLPDLPNKTYTNILVGDVDSSLQKKLDELWEEWGSFIEVEGQLPPFEEFSEIRAKLAHSRIPAMLEYIENAEEQDVPLVVFSSHLSPLDALSDRPGWAIISGKTSSENRQQIVRDFQAGKYKGVGISIRAGGVGLTLTHAWKALFVDLDWTPGSNWQAEDRLARIGQKSNKVEIVRMVSDHPLDIHIQNLLADKIDTIHLAVDNMIAGQKIIGESEEQFEFRMQDFLNKQTIYTQKQKEIAESERKKLAKVKVGGIHQREKARLKKQVLPLTPERVDAVRAAFKFMISICDGALTHDAQGFNKPDAAVAHWLLSAGLETIEEVEAGQFMLTRYKRQLEEKFPILFKN